MIRFGFCSSSSPGSVISYGETETFFIPLNKIKTPLPTKKADLFVSSRTIPPKRDLSPLVKALLANDDNSTGTPIFVQEYNKSSQSPDSFGKTPLEWLALFGRVDVLQEIFKTKIDTGIKKTELLQLAKAQRQEIQKLKHRDLDKNEVLFDAVKPGEIFEDNRKKMDKRFRKLIVALQAGANVNVRDPWVRRWVPEETPETSILEKAFSTSCIKDIERENRLRKINWDVLEILKAVGANVNQPGSFGRTPLQQAIESAQEPELVQWLLEAGAHWNWSDFEKCRELQRGQQHGKIGKENLARSQELLTANYKRRLININEST